MSPWLGLSQDLEGKLRGKPGRTKTTSPQQGNSKQELEPRVRPRQKEHWNGCRSGTWSGPIAVNSSSPAGNEHEMSTTGRKTQGGNGSQTAKVGSRKESFLHHPKYIIYHR